MRVNRYGSRFFVARFKPLLLFIFLPVVGLFFFTHFSELVDPYIGPAMATDAGRFYVFSSWAAPVLVLIGGGLGCVLRRRNVKANT